MAVAFKKKIIEKPAFKTPIYVLFNISMFTNTVCMSISMSAKKPYFSSNVRLKKRVVLLIQFRQKKSVCTIYSMVENQFLNVMRHTDKRTNVEKRSC